MTFAALMDRTNASVFARLANMTANIGSAVNVPVIFSNGYGDEFSMIGGSNPQIKCLSADVVGVYKGAAVGIGVVSYIVLDINPDGTGVTVIRLEEI